MAPVDHICFWKLAAKNSSAVRSNGVHEPTAALFAVMIPARSMRSLMMVVPPDPEHPWKNVKTKDGGPVLSFQLDRVPEIAVTALDRRGHVVAHGVAIVEPGGPSPTPGPTH